MSTESFHPPKERSPLLPVRLKNPSPKAGPPPQTDQPCAPAIHFTAVLNLPNFVQTLYNHRVMLEGTSVKDCYESLTMWFLQQVRFRGL